MRSSLDKAINEQYSLTNQLELAKKKAIRVEQLEDEISMYRDTVKLVAVENQRSVYVLHCTSAVLDNSPKYSFLFILVMWCLFRSL